MLYEIQLGYWDTAAHDRIYCFVSCQSNCGHVASTSVWARYLSFFALICSNYFGFFITITRKEPNCFLQDASPPWNHQYALSLREKLSICSPIITSSSHEKAATAVFSKISHFMFRVMERLMYVFLWDLLREGQVFKKCPPYSMWQWGTLGSSALKSRRGFHSSLPWSDMQFLLTTSKLMILSNLCCTASFLAQAINREVADPPILALSPQLSLIFPLSNKSWFGRVSPSIFYVHHKELQIMNTECIKNK